MEKFTIKQIANIIKKSNSKADIEKAENLAGKYLRGVARPSYENIILLEQRLSIPFSAWKDIKSFISKNNDNSNKPSSQGVDKKDYLKENR